MFMKTRRQAALYSHMNEDEIRNHKRTESAKASEAVLPELVDRYAEDYTVDCEELIWAGKGPSEDEMKRYLEETKKRNIRIDVAHAILFDHGMNIYSSLKMIDENALVPVDLVSSTDKVIIKSMESMLGRIEEKKIIGSKMFPGFAMTNIFNDAFNQKLKLLSSHTAQLDRTKKSVSKQMRELEAKRESYGECKKGKKNRRNNGISRNRTPESSTTSSSNCSRASSLAEDEVKPVPSIIIRRVSIGNNGNKSTVPVFATVTSPESLSVRAEIISTQVQYKKNMEDREKLGLATVTREGSVVGYTDKLQTTSGFDSSKPLPPIPYEDDDDCIILASTPTSVINNNRSSSSSPVQIINERLNTFIRPSVRIQKESNVWKEVNNRTETISKSTLLPCKRAVIEPVRVASRSYTPAAKKICITID